MIPPWAAAALAGGLGALALRDLAGPLVRRSTRAAVLGAAMRHAVRGRTVLARIAPPVDLGARLVAAGEPGRLRPREWMALKAGTAAMVGVPSLAVIATGPGRIAALLALAGPPAGFVAPDFWLARAIRARAEAALRELPDLLELLRVSVEAGLPSVRAMGTVAAQFDGPLAVEWRRVAAAVALGEPPAEAIARMGERIASDEVKGLAHTLLRGRRHGLPLGAALGSQAARARDARRRRIRERAARAGPKMQLVVALVLVPSMLLIVAALLVTELGPVMRPLA